MGEKGGICNPAIKIYFLNKLYQIITLRKVAKISSVGQLKLDNST